MAVIPDGGFSTRPSAAGAQAAVSSANGSVTSANSSLNAAQQRLSTAQSGLSAIKGQDTDARSAVTTATAAVTSAKADARTATTAYTTAASNITGLKTAARTAATAVDSATTAVKDAGTELDDLVQDRSTYTTKVTDAKADKTKADAEVKELGTKVTGLTADVAEAKSEYDGLVKATATAKTEQAAAAKTEKSTGDALTAAKAKTADARADLTKANATLQDARGDASRAAAAVGTAQGRLNSAKSNLAAAERAANSAEAYARANPKDAAAQSRARAARARANSLKGAVAEAQRALDAAKETERQARQAEKEAKAAADRAKTAKEAAEKAEAAAKKAADEAKKAREAADRKLKEAEKAEKEAKVQLERLQKELKKAEADQKKAIEAARKAADAVTKAEKELAQLDTKITAARKAKTDAQSKLDEAKKKKADADKALKEAESKLRDLEKAKADATRKVADAEKTLKTAETRLKEATARIKEAQDRVRAAEDQVKAAKASVDAAQQRLESAKTKAAAAEEAAAAARTKSEKKAAQGAEIDANLTPAQREKLVRDQEALAAAEAAVAKPKPSQARSDRQAEGQRLAQEAYNAKVHDIREAYFDEEGHEIWIDADGTAYQASLDRAGNIQLNREEKAPATAQTPPADVRRTATIRTDRSRTSQTQVRPERTPDKHDVEQTITHTVHNDPSGKETGSARRIEQEQTNTAGVHKTVAVEEDFDANRTLERRTTDTTEKQPSGRNVATSDATTFRPDGTRIEQAQSSTTTEADGSTRADATTTSFRPNDSVRHVAVSNETVNADGTQRTSRKVDTDYAENGTDPTRQVVVEAGTGQPTVTADTEYTRGVADSTFISRSGAGRATGVPPTEYVEYDERGRVTTHAAGGPDNSRESYEDALDARRDAGTHRRYESGGPGLSDLSGDSLRLLDPDAPVPPGHRAAIEYTRGDDNRFSGTTQAGLLAPPLEPSRETPSAFDVPAAIRTQAVAANLDRIAPAPGTAEYDRLVQEQDAYERRFAEAKTDAQRAELQRRYFDDHPVWIDRGPDGKQEPVAMASAYVQGLPPSDMFGSSRAQQPHVAMARTGIEGTSEAGEAQTTDWLRNVYNDGSTDEIVHTVVPGRGGAGSETTVGEHRNAAGVLTEKDLSSTRTQLRTEQGLEPITITDISRERFNGSTGKPEGEQYYATATSDRTTTSLREQKDVFGADGIIDSTEIDETTRSRDFSQSSVDDFARANHDAIERARRNDFHVDEDATSITVPPVGSFSSTKETDISYDAQGRAIHETVHEVNQSVQATTDEEYDEEGNLVSTTVDPNGVKLTTVTTDRERGSANGTTPIFDADGKPLGDQRVRTNIHTVAFDPDDGTAGGNKAQEHQWREVTDITTSSTVRPDGTQRMDWVTPYKVQVLQEGFDDDWGFEEKQLKAVVDGESFKIATDKDGKPVELGEGDAYTDAKGVDKRFDRDPKVEHSDLDFADDFESFMEDYGSKIVMGATLVAGVALAFTGVGTAAGLALIGVGLTLSSAQLAYTTLNYRQGEASGWDVALDAVGVAGFAVSGIQGVRALSAAAKAAKGGTAASAAVRGGAAAVGTVDDTARAATYGQRALQGVRNATVGRVAGVADDPLTAVHLLGDAGDVYDGSQAIKAAINGDWTQAAMFIAALGANGVAGRAGAGWRANHTPGANLSTPDVTAGSGAGANGAPDISRVPGTPATSSGAPAVATGGGGATGRAVPLTGSNAGGGAGNGNGNGSGSNGGPAAADSAVGGSRGDGADAPRSAAPAGNDALRTAGERVDTPAPQPGLSLEVASGHGLLVTRGGAVVNAAGDASVADATVAAHLVKRHASPEARAGLTRLGDVAGFDASAPLPIGAVVAVRGADGGPRSFYRVEGQGLATPSTKNGATLDHAAPVRLDTVLPGGVTPDLEVNLASSQFSQHLAHDIQNNDGVELRRIIDQAAADPDARVIMDRDNQVTIIYDTGSHVGTDNFGNATTMLRIDFTTRTAPDAGVARSFSLDSAYPVHSDWAARGTARVDLDPSHPLSTAAGAPAAADQALPFGRPASRDGVAPLERPIPIEREVVGGLRVSAAALNADPALLVGQRVAIPDQFTADPRFAWTVSSSNADGTLNLTRTTNRGGRLEDIIRLNPEAVGRAGGPDAVRQDPRLLSGQPLRLQRSSGAIQDGWQIAIVRDGGSLDLVNAETRTATVAELAQHLPATTDLGAAIVARQRVDPSFDGRAALTEAIRREPSLLNDRPLRIRRSSSSIAEGRAAHNIDDGWYVSAHSVDSAGNPRLLLAKKYFVHSLSPKVQKDLKKQGYGPNDVVELTRSNVRIEDVIDYNRARLEGDHGQLPRISVFDAGQHGAPHIGTGRNIAEGPSHGVADQAVVHAQAALDYMYSRYGYVPTGRELRIIINDANSHNNASMQSSTNTLRIGTNDGTAAAFDPSVIAHELGHKMVDDLTAGHYGRTQAGAIHEGFADVMAASWTHDPIIGRTFGRDGQVIRDIRTGTELIGTRQQWDTAAVRNAEEGVSPHRGSGVVSGTASRIADIPIGTNRDGTPITLGWAETGDLFHSALRSGGLSSRMDFDTFGDSLRTAAATRYGVQDARYEAVVKALDDAGLVRRPEVGTMVARLTTRGTIEHGWRVVGYDGTGQPIIRDGEGLTLVPPLSRLLNAGGVGIRVDANGRPTYDYAGRSGGALRRADGGDEAPGIGAAA